MRAADETLREIERGEDELIPWEQVKREMDKDSFSLQGYWRAKFNPDLIAFTDSGKIAVLEHKGEDRVTNEDSRYKESLGNDWAALDPERRYFKMVTKGNMQSTLKEIEEL